MKVVLTCLQLQASHSALQPGSFQALRVITLVAASQQREHDKLKGVLLSMQRRIHREIRKKKNVLHLILLLKVWSSGKGRGSTRSGDLGEAYHAAHVDSRSPARSYAAYNHWGTVYSLVIYLFAIYFHALFIFLHIFLFVNM